MAGVTRLGTIANKEVLTSTTFSKHQYHWHNRLCALSNSSLEVKDTKWQTPLCVYKCRN